MEREAEGAAMSMPYASQIAAATGSNLAAAQKWANPLADAMLKYDITTPQRQAAFLAQAGHESQGLSRVVENLNYTPEALITTFNTKVTRFIKIDAFRYGRTPDHPANQEIIANIAYCGRMGNGPFESGDGYRFRGRGIGQITGKDNYAACGKAIGLDLVANPEKLELPSVGAMAFAWFWDSNKLNPLADIGDFIGISGAINCGTAKAPQSRINGLAARMDLWAKAKTALGVK